MFCVIIQLNIFFRSLNDFLGHIHANLSLNFMVQRDALALMKDSIRKSCWSYVISPDTDILQSYHSNPQTLSKHFQELPFLNNTTAFPAVCLMQIFDFHRGDHRCHGKLPA